MPVLVHAHLLSALLSVAAGTPQATPDTSQRRFETDALSGRGDPVRAAKEAAARGDFGLVWVSSFSPARARTTVDVACRFPPYHPNTGRTVLTSANVYISDLADGNDPARQVPLFAYAGAYNRTLVADPTFPYADLCRGDAADPLVDPTPDLPATLVPAGVAETDTPHDLGEAARHGTIAAVRRLLSATSAADLDRPDDFGLTPLAWAVIGQRGTVADALLARGADPLAPGRHSRVAPLRLALLYGRQALAGRMIAGDVARRARPWSWTLIDAAIRGRNVGLTRRMLIEENEGVGALVDLLALASATGDARLLSTIMAVGKDSGAALAEAAVKRKDPALLRRALAMRPRLPAPGADQSLLGDAVLRGGKVTDRLVALLLGYGVPADSPADWGRDGRQIGSPTPTALVALVALANRAPSPGDRDVAWTDTAAAQRRTLDALLAHGASVRAVGSDHRPLAVYLVAGEYDPYTRGAMQQEIPPDWIERLAAAGMDVNATWLGSTALDWLDATAMGDSRTARTIERLGGRRIHPASTPLSRASTRRQADASAR